MRSNAHRALPSAGRVSWSSERRRVAIYPAEGDYLKLCDRAQAMGCGVGPLAQQIIEAWCKGEPPPVFVGAEERS